MSFYFCETYCTLSPNSLGFPIFLGTVEAPAPKAPPKRVASQPGRSPKGVPSSAAAKKSSRFFKQEDLCGGVECRPSYCH